MKKLAVIGAVGVLFGAVVADAAPGVAAPGATGRTPAPGRVITTKPLGPKVEFLSRANTCGQPEKARVKVSNPTKAPIQGTASLVDSTGATSSRGYGVAAGASSTFDIDGTVLDCSKAVKAQEVRVFGPNEALIEGRRTKPTTISMGQSFPPAGSGVWIRSLHVQGACGGPVSANAVLRSQANAPVEAKLTLAMGAAKEQFAVTIPPGAEQHVKLQIPSLDCSSGIPSLDYHLVSGGSAKGTLPPTGVTFQPGEKL